MDPVSALGLAASIIAVMQLAGALIKPATSSLGPSENDEKELNKLSTTMTGFQIAYNNLEMYLKSDPDTAETLVKQIQQPIQECKAVLSELKLRLSTMTFVRKHIVGKKWDKGFKNILKRLDDARQLFDVILQGDQSTRLIKISQFIAEKSKDIEGFGQRLSEIHTTVRGNQSKLETQAAQNHSELRLKMDDYQHNIEKQEQRKLKEDILRWLTIVDPSINHDSAYTNHKPGTGSWFIKGKPYRQWLTAPNSFFWLNGKAGCGKTILTSTIIENTTKYCDDNQGCVIAYFYFSFTDTAKQQSSSMLFSLLAQIASQVDITPDCLGSVYRTYQRSTPPMDALKKALQILIEEMPLDDIYMIVDALDEIPDLDGRNKACEILNELSQSSKAHILTTSRREHDITECMSEFNFIVDILIQNPEVDHDILLYVREQLKEDKKLKRWSAALHSEIEEALSGQADGMFRWAACQLDALKKCLSENAVRKALKSLPKTLDDTYERILLSIDNEYQDLAVEALRWLCFSTRVLEVRELAEAAVFSTTAQCTKETPLEVSFDVRDRMQDPLDILGILSGLAVYRLPNVQDDDGFSDDDDFSDININHDPSIAGTDKTKGKVLLSHFSVKEYLVSSRLGSKVEQFALHEDRSHEILATKCLYYTLYFQLFIDDRGKISCGNSSAFDYHLSDYAFGEWVDHAQKVDYESELTHLIISFIETRDSPGSTLPQLWNDTFQSKVLPPIYLTSLWGLYWPCKKLAETGPHVNIQGGYYGSALQAASSNSQESIVQLLLSNGADTNIQGGYYGSALQAASCRYNERMIQLLLDHGADVNIQGGHYGSALYTASYEGNKDIVQLLLDHGADVKIDTGLHHNPLEAALVQKHVDIALMLLEYGMEVKSCCGYGAKEALAKKEFRRFIDIEMEAIKSYRRRENRILR